MESGHKLTKILVYPLFSNMVNMRNLILFASDKGFTIKSTENPIQNDDGIIFGILDLNETLTQGQKTTITDIFKGTAYIKFS